MTSPGRGPRWGFWVHVAVGWWGFLTGLGTLWTVAMNITGELPGAVWLLSTPLTLTGLALVITGTRLICPRGARGTVPSRARLVAFSHLLVTQASITTVLGAMLLAVQQTPAAAALTALLVLWAAATIPYIPLIPIHHGFEEGSSCP